MALAALVPRDWTPVQVYFGISTVLAIIGWTSLARVIRGKLLSLREEDYVTAAKISGVGEWAIVTRHLLPGFASYLIVHLTLAIPQMILGEVSLSFLGLGLRPPAVSLGTLAPRRAEHPDRDAVALAPLPGGSSSCSSSLPSTSSATACATPSIPTGRADAMPDGALPPISRPPLIEVEDLRVSPATRGRHADRRGRRQLPHRARRNRRSRRRIGLRQDDDGAVDPASRPAGRGDDRQDPALSRRRGRPSISSPSTAREPLSARSAAASAR